MTDQLPMNGQDLPAGDILVVDDNLANLVAIEAALGSLGGEVVRAGSGREALRVLLERDFALVLLDVKMPSMDGFETARMIRARKRSQHTPIIFVTAHGRDDHDMLAAYALGAVDFLSKPLEPDVLRAKAGVFVELQRRAAELARQAELIRRHERREHERTLFEERARWEAEALRRQMEQLAETDRRKDHFLAVLSHELRNPLAPLVTGLELLRTQLADYPELDARVSRTRLIMERQVQQLSRLVDDLLDISRISSGKIELRKAALAVHDVVDQAVATSRPHLDGRKHTLSVELPDSPLILHGDAVRLVQVIANLLNNAARYTAPGGRVTLRATRQGDTLELRVKDSGRGIDPDQLESIFDAFAQVKQAGSGGDGLGLGLTVVRSIVGLHEGSVHALSTGPGQGSEFVVRLPLQTGLAADSGKTVSTPARDAGRSLSVVLVEDGEDIRELIADLLRDWGHAVTVASDGRAGAELVINTQPDVAFIDIGLPVLDGYEVAARVRAAPLPKAPRLVAMTGFGQESDKQRALAAGFDHHLVKPASVEALKAALVFEDTP
jgi:signal transduction histidine kinase